MENINKELEIINKKCFNILNFIKDKNIETLTKSSIRTLIKTIEENILMAYTPEKDETDEQSDQKIEDILRDVKEAYGMLINFCEQVVPDFEEKNIDLSENISLNKLKSHISELKYMNNKLKKYITLKW